METRIINIKETQQHSNAASYAIATAVSKAVGAVMPLMPRRMKASLYEWAYIKEHAIWEQRFLTGNYPSSTWYGLNGVDQYDLVADFVMLNAYKAGVR
jgi:hypothetical protein